MYYNVVVKDKANNFDISINNLVFHFEENFEEAFEFMKTVLKTTNYCVEFLQIKENNEEE